MPASSPSVRFSRDGQVWSRKPLRTAVVRKLCPFLGATSRCRPNRRRFAPPCQALVRLGGEAGVVGLDARPKPQQPRGWRGHTAGEPRIAGERWWPTSSATRRVRADRPRFSFDAAPDDGGGCREHLADAETLFHWRVWLVRVVRPYTASVVPRQPSRHHGKAVPIRPASPLPSARRCRHQT